jgi:hypothetical protein
MNFEGLIYVEDFAHGDLIRVYFEDAHANFELHNLKRFGMKQDPSGYPEEYAFAKICQLYFTPGLDELDDPYVDGGD